MSKSSRHLADELARELVLFLSLIPVIASSIECLGTPDQFC